MKPMHAKLGSLIEKDRKENVGGLGALLDAIEAPRGQRLDVLANRPLNMLYGRHLFREEYAVSDARDLFESLLSNLPEERVDDLRKLFMLAFFEGMVRAGRELALDDQHYAQKETGRRGGKRAGAARARKAADDWQDAALLIAQEYQQRNPGAGQVRIAKEIARTLPGAPGAEQLRKVVAVWQQQGFLRRVRSRVANPLHTPSK